MQVILLKYLVIPIIVGLEVIGIAHFYPIYKDSFWKSLLFFIVVFTIHEIYRLLVNYCSTLNL